MRKQDFYKLYKYIDIDDKVYVIIKGMSFYPKTPVRDLLFEEVSKLPKEQIIELVCNVGRNGLVQLSTMSDKSNTNSILIREKYLTPILQRLKFDINTLVKSNELKVKYTEHIYAQELHKYKTIKGKRVKPQTSQEKLSYWTDRMQKELLNKSTKSEYIVKKKLKSAFGRRVKEQHPYTINGKVYFADFCIKSKKLIIEVDGGYHNSDEQKQKDAIRDAAFKSIGYTTIRITNEQTKDKFFMSEFINNIKSIN